MLREQVDKMSGLKDDFDFGVAISNLAKLPLWSCAADKIAEAEKLLAK